MTGYTEDTVPSRRVEPERVRSKPAAIPAYVWLLGFAVLLLALTVCGLWALYLLRGQIAIGGPTPTPIIWTPTPVASPTPPPTETAEPTPTISPDIAIGRYVRVADTEGYGLSLRSGPGENYPRMDVALEGEVFIVVDGPTVSGGSEWWKVRDPENEEREWWAIGNFLEPVEHP
nr:SH3 domain-containing protein [Anaerolineae bacterium]